MTRITSAEALARLFDDFNWFECGKCLTMWPLPDREATPVRVEMVLQDFGIGGLDAGDLRTYQSLRLAATEVLEWSTPMENITYAPDHSMQGAEPVEADAGVGFMLDVPDLVRLVARAFECERLPDITAPVARFTSDRGLYVVAEDAGLPSPGDWLRVVASAGVEAVWRMLGGNEQPTSRMPQNYTGWFLERPSRLSEHNGGVFFRDASVDNRRVAVVNLERWQADDELWLAICRCVTRIFPNGQFRSGNCRFTAEEWLAHLETGST